MRSQQVALPRWLPSGPRSQPDDDWEGALKHAKTNHHFARGLTGRRSRLEAPTLVRGAPKELRLALRWGCRTVGVGELGEVDGEEERLGAHEDAVGGLADGFDPELAAGAVS